MSEQGAKATLDEATVRKIAVLGRLKLTDADVHLYSEQLTAILDYVEQLKEVNVEGVEPMAHPLPLHNVLREDVVEPSLPVAVALANAPLKDEEFFLVPKVLDTALGGG